MPSDSEPLAALGSIGFIGTGALTAAVVRGLRARSPDPAIRLSPRSETQSNALVREFVNVVRDPSNAAVVENSDTIILAVRPQQLETALSGVSFRADQIVVSFVATVLCADLAKLVTPASQVCRVTPLSTIAAARGPIVISPALDKVDRLFEGLGDLIYAASESQMAAFGCAAGLLSSFFEIENEVAQWLTSTGVPSTDASLYVRSMFVAAARSGLEARGVSLHELAAAHETAGGLNEHARRRLLDTGWFADIRDALTQLSTLSLGQTHG